MSKLVTKGKARAIGLSNFSVTQISELLPTAQELGIPISCLQIEVHPWLPQTKLIEFCKKEGIVVSCYSPFAGQKKDGKTLILDEVVKGLAEKNGLGVGGLLQSAFSSSPFFFLSCLIFSGFVFLLPLVRLRISC